MQLVLNTNGLVMKVKDKVFYVTDGKEHRKISPEQVDSVAVTAPCLISSAAIMLAADAGIPIYFFDRFGEGRSSLRSPWFDSIATLRRKQVYFSDSVNGSQWIIHVFQQKTAHQIQVLKYLANRKKRMAKLLQKTIDHLQGEWSALDQQVKIPSAEWSASIMGWEGSMARVYWQCIGQCLPGEWSFNKRSRRPAKDPFNAMINYGYGMLYNKIEQALFAAGLDPHLGILHADEYDSPTLSYDLIEVFRPWVDRLVIENILTGAAIQEGFEVSEEGVYLNATGKRWFIPAFNAWLLARVRWNKKQLTREGHFYHAAAQLAKSIN